MNDEKEWGTRLPVSEFIRRAEIRFGKTWAELMEPWRKAEQEGR